MVIARDIPQLKRGGNMIIDGTCANFRRGRLSDEARNLKRFSEQWTEFTDEEPALTFTDDDAKYIAETLHLEGPDLSRYHIMADTLEV